jgi:hypothetical protein
VFVLAICEVLRILVRAKATLDGLHYSGILGIAAYAERIAEDLNTTHIIKTWLAKSYAHAEFILLAFRFVQQIEDKGIVPIREIADEDITEIVAP